MTSTTRSTTTSTTTRTSHCLAASVLLAGIALWSTAIAGARPETLNEDAYNACVAAGNPGVEYDDLVAQCCYMAGGDTKGMGGTVPYCDAPDIDPGCCTREDVVETPQIVDAPDVSMPTPSRPAPTPVPQAPNRGIG
ncbi:hypothetical protein [Mycolicibacterium setense]|uniref:hypothetical protein n=1 Tax=Mycolicibacterium setense TaxID=431269 RepID=UPI00103A9F04|nr:hypothetical protein [Mycolicibacterium setense]MCV7115192.1 hypothetical protein [Mycolicibacterium setense]